MYNVLQDKSINHLDMLVISHFHDDHIGGLAKVLTWASSVDKVLAPVDYYESDTFIDLNQQLSVNGCRISVPSVGDKYKLGSAEIEILDLGTQGNDSIVLLIRYISDVSDRIPD